jgi:hypothetical protein
LDDLHSRANSIPGAAGNSGSAWFRSPQRIGTRSRAVRPDFVGGGFSTAGSRTMCGWTRGPLGARRPPRSSLFAKRARAVTAKPSNHGRMATNPDHDVARETRCAGLMSDLAGKPARGRRAAEAARVVAGRCRKAEWPLGERPQGGNSIGMNQGGRLARATIVRSVLVPLRELNDCTAPGSSKSSSPEVLQQDP